MGNILAQNVQFVSWFSEQVRLAQDLRDLARWRGPVRRPTTRVGRRELGERNDVQYGRSDVGWPGLRK